MYECVWYTCYLTCMRYTHVYISPICPYHIFHKENSRACKLLFLKIKIIVAVPLSIIIMGWGSTGQVAVAIMLALSHSRKETVF